MANVYSETVSYPADFDVRTAIRSAAGELGWTLSEHPDRIAAVTKMGFSSYGENIEIAFYANQSFNITSRCMAPFQLFDWGRNKKNVKLLLKKMGLTV